MRTRTRDRQESVDPMISKNSKSKQKTNVLLLLFFSIVVILFGQISITFYTQSFHLAIGVVPLAIILFLMEDVDVLAVSIFAGIGITAALMVTDTFPDPPGAEAFLQHYPEGIFYIIYGVLITLFFRLSGMGHRQGLIRFLPLLAADYLANVAELFLRLGTASLDQNLQFGILLAAVVRMIVTALSVMLIEHYGFVMIRAESLRHYEEQQYLLARIREESIWMSKNASQIEDVMQDSYRLYRELQQAVPPSPASGSALQVATGIHEIKKEYLLAIKSIDQLMEGHTPAAMNLTELFRVLNRYAEVECRECGKKLQFDFVPGEEILTDQIYPLISIFRNLFTNAIEACPGDEVCIRVTQEDPGNGMTRFTVTDRGTGIPEEDLPNIFTPGFSTRINYDTGEVSRGLGLPLVKELAESLGGTIQVSREAGLTSFIVTLNRSKLEAPRENISTR